MRPQHDTRIEWLAWGHWKNRPVCPVKNCKQRVYYRIQYMARLPGESEKEWSHTSFRCKRHARLFAISHGLEVPTR